jgi:hypothetical protein
MAIMVGSGDRHEEAGSRYRRHRIDRNARFCGHAEEKETTAATTARGEHP